jgi:hypothetical protein
VGSLADLLLLTCGDIGSSKFGVDFVSILSILRNAGRFINFFAAHRLENSISFGGFGSFR